MIHPIQKPNWVQSRANLRIRTWNWAQIMCYLPKITNNLWLVIKLKLIMSTDLEIATIIRACVKTEDCANVKKKGVKIAEIYQPNFLRKLIRLQKTRLIMFRRSSSQIIWQDPTQLFGEIITRVTKIIPFRVNLWDRHKIYTTQK